MVKKQQSAAHLTVRDETVVVPPGEVSYWLLLDDEEVEAMAAGGLPDRVKARSADMLGWKKPAAEDPFFTRKSA